MEGIRVKYYAIHG